MEPYFNQRDLDQSRQWMFIMAITGAAFLAACLVVVGTRSPNDDWFPVIWLAVMSGLCFYSCGVIAVLRHLFKSES
jgi:hypothetical protein